MVRRGSRRIFPLHRRVENVHLLPRLLRRMIVVVIRNSIIISTTLNNNIRIRMLNSNSSMRRIMLRQDDILAKDTPNQIWVSFGCGMYDLS